ncbi:MAG: heavy metal translocating P-type ATPase [Acholeplasmatales bacterium]
MFKVITYEIEGLNCEACKNAVEVAAIKVKGVHKATVNLREGTIRLVVSKHFNEEVFFKAITLSGFKAKQVTSNFKRQSKSLSTATKLAILLFFLVLLLYLSVNEIFKLPLPSILNPKINPINYLVVQLSITILILVVGYKYYLSGFKNLFKLKPNIESLVAISISVGFLYSIYITIMVLIGNKEYISNLYFSSVGMILLFVLLGQYLKQTQTTTTELEKLIKLKPNKAVKYDKDNYVEVPIEEVKVGDLIVVNKGDKIPVDGIIKKGCSSIDEQIIMGRKEPIEKGVGDKVICGTTNLNEEIIIKVTHVGKETTLEAIICGINESRMEKTPLEKTTDKISSYFIPLVFLIALLGFILWLIFTKDFNHSLNIFASVLVISCPCALGLTTITPSLTISGILANYGIIVSNRKAIEMAHKGNLVVFNKTGTITKGKLTLKEIITTSNYFEQELLQIALSLELKIKNPFAEAIKTYTKDLNIKEREVINFENHVSLGLKGEINGQVYFIGNEKWMLENNIKISQERNILKKGEGKSYLYIGSNVLIGLISFSDELKEETKEVIKKLHELNIKTVLLSSDDEMVVAYIAKEAGILEYYGSLLVDDKKKIIKKLKEQYTVLMVGNQNNDLSLLKEADYGISLGDENNMALSSCDVILTNNLSSLITLMSLSKIITKNIKENIFWAFFYNILGIILALGVLYSFNIRLNQIIASLLMILSSISIILNALKLKRFRG